MSWTRRWCASDASTFLAIELNPSRQPRAPFDLTTPERPPTSSTIRPTRNTQHQSHSRASSGASLATTELADLSIGSPVRHTSTLLSRSPALVGRLTPPNSQPNTVEVPFADVRESSLSSSRASKKPLLYSEPAARPLHRVKSGEFGSPIRVPSASSSRNVSLNMSPGTSDGMSLRYDESQLMTESPTAAPKWRVHFAKPPSKFLSPSGPIPLEQLVRTAKDRLGLDELVVRALPTYFNTSHVAALCR